MCTRLLLDCGILFEQDGYKVVVIITTGQTSGLFKGPYAVVHHFWLYGSLSRTALENHIDLA